MLTLKSFITRAHSLTTVLSSNTTDLSLTITNVYAPSDHRDSRQFLDGLAELAGHIAGPWLVVGDFNLVRDLSDKNNNSFNANLAAAFNSTLHSLALLELPLLDRLFTWTNNRSSPTLARLDRVFINNDFASLCPNTTLSSLPRITSDHTPFLATISTTIPKPSSFRFDTSWLRYPDFLPAVLPAWYSTHSPGNASGHLAGSLKAVRHAAKIKVDR
ncbi:hypothetical protein EJB05_31429, partial [Eragrostis curvula]